MAKSFSALGEVQQRRAEMMADADKERQAEFLRFQREQAELNRQHELKMMEMMMKFTNPPNPAHYVTCMDQPKWPSNPQVTAIMREPLALIICSPSYSLICPRWHLRQVN